MFKNKTINCVIPARMSSSRFHGKPLAKIHGREMILRVAEIASLSAYVDRVIVATEDPIIQRTCEIHGYESMLTDKHYTCTHRVAEVADRIKSDYVFNLQGDEPLTRVSWIDDIISHGVANDYDMVQASRKLEEGELEDEDVVKMIENNNRVMHMQRTPDVVCSNITVQLGLYFYRHDVIRNFPNLDMTFVKYWKGLDTIGFCGRYNVIPFDLECGKIRAVDRPEHIKEVEDNL